MVLGVTKVAAPVTSISHGLPGYGYGGYGKLIIFYTNCIFFIFLSNFVQ